MQKRKSRAGRQMGEETKREKSDREKTTREGIKGWLIADSSTALSTIRRTK